MTAEWELTDTFGGEANYSWVRNGTVEADDDESAINQVLQAIGWTRESCESIHNFGDCIEIKPKDLCQVCYITWPE